MTAAHGREEGGDRSVLTRAALSANIAAVQMLLRPDEALVVFLDVPQFGSLA
jgi:hypothetical protein